MESLERDRYKDKTKLNLDIGTYYYFHILGDLQNVIVLFQTTLDTILSTVQWNTCLDCIVDVVFFSKDNSQRIKKIYEVLALHWQATVALRVARSYFFQKEIKYCNLISMLYWSAVDFKNLGAIKIRFSPTGNTRLRSFMGACNVYKTFIICFLNLLDHSINTHAKT